MRLAVRTFPAAGFLLAGALLCGQPQVLPTGWRLTPAGRQTPLEGFPMSAVLSADGKHLVVLQAGQKPGLSVIEVASGRVSGAVPMSGVWHGLTITPRGDRVYAGGGPRAVVFEFSLAGGVLTSTRTFEVVPAARRSAQDFIGDVALSPDGRLLYAAELFRDSVAVVNPQSGMTISRIKTGRRPYRILFHPDGKSLFVSHWADGSVGHYDAATGSLLTTVRIAPHPTDLLWRNGGPAEPAPGEPAWAARLFVAAANTNSVYTVAVSPAKELRVIENINMAMTPHQPLGMTPAALALSADQNKIFVACSGANAVAVVNVTGDRSFVEGFIPTGAYPAALRALPSGGFAVLNAKGDPGSASWIDSLNQSQLDGWTRAVEANAEYRDSRLMDVVSLPAIRHVVYVVREAPADVAAPNLQKLGREFVRFDNFHAIGDSPAERYQWSTAAIASDFTVKLAAGKQLDPEPQDPAAAPAAGYLWTNATLAGISIRNFGFTMRDPVLTRFTNPEPDRAKAFLSELAGFKADSMPRLTLIRVSGAGSDAAVGAIVEGISKSQFWSSAAIFVMDVRPSRASAVVVSPYAKRRTIDTAMHNTTSMLRTIEFLLGLRPMTHFDAGSIPMTAAFQTRPDPAPFTAETK